MPHLLASRTSWAGGKASQPGYLGSTAAAKLLLRLLVRFWPEEDFEEERGRGEGSLEGTRVLERLQEKGWGWRWFKKWKRKAKQKI